MNPENDPEVRAKDKRHFWHVMRENALRIFGLFAVYFCAILIINPHMSALGRIAWFVVLFLIALVLFSVAVSSEREHKNILFTKDFRPLENLGFEIENVNTYWGYKGNYLGYYYKIFYRDANSKYERSELRIMLYYLPIKADDELIKQLQQALDEKYVRGWMYKTFRSSDVITFRKAYVTVGTNWSFYNSFSHIKEKMDMLHQLALDEKLEPVDEASISQLIQADGKLYAPETPRYFDLDA